MRRVPLHPFFPLLVLAVLLGAAGCRPSASSNAAAVRPGPVPASDFSLKDLSGKTVALADFKGKVVFLDFWATWCPPCRASLPEVRKLSADYAGRPVQILGVNLDEDQGDVPPYVKKKGIDYPVLLAGASEVGELYGVRGIPHFVVIDREGRVVDEWSGFAPDMPQVWRRTIDRLLAAGSAPPAVRRTTS